MGFCLNTHPCLMFVWAVAWCVLASGDPWQASDSAPMSKVVTAENTAEGGCVTLVQQAAMQDRFAGVSTDDFSHQADRVEVVSGGFAHGNRVLIRYDGHTFFDVRTAAPACAGLYLVAIYKNRVLVQTQYNTFTTPGASEGLARDIDALPGGALVIVAVKDEATRLFDRRGQEALNKIGAARGLLDKPFRTSYLCVGMKGLAPGAAIEQAGPALQQHLGSKADQSIRLQFPVRDPPSLPTFPGLHEGVMLGETEVCYYIPKRFDSADAEYVFLIHGAGDWHRPGALAHIAIWRNLADRENLILVAPIFDCTHNWPVDPRKELDEAGRFKDRRIIRDWRLWDFVGLLNPHNSDRADVKLIEIFELFVKQVVPRTRFTLYGHSGGGQFVARFAMLHAELLDRAACSSAGTYAFPNRHRDYPWGLNMDKLEKTFGSQIVADDLRLSADDLNDRLRGFLNLDFEIIVGSEETGDDHPDLVWQGHNVLERAGNFHAALRREHQRLKQAADERSSGRFRARLHIMDGVGHDALAAGETAQRLLFPPRRR